jgi:transcriptional regulator with XRE-family HTH domain
MITARQSRAARALLGWTQETLADKARISLTALKRLESENRLEVYETTRDQVRRALEAAGIVHGSRAAGSVHAIIDPLLRPVLVAGKEC